MMLGELAFRIRNRNNCVEMLSNRQSEHMVSLVLAGRLWMMSLKRFMLSLLLGSCESMAMMLVRGLSRDFNR